MDRNLNDVYQEDAVACSNASLLENGNVMATEQLEPDILLSIKKEDLVCPYNLTHFILFSSAHTVSLLSTLCTSLGVLFDFYFWTKETATEPRL